MTKCAQSTASAFDVIKHEQGTVKGYTKKKKKRGLRPIRSRHLREGGDDTQESCSVCLQMLFSGKDNYNQKVQCPSCCGVLHKKCFHKWLSNGEDSCPNRRSTIPDIEHHEKSFSYRRDEWLFHIDPDSEADDPDFQIT